MKETSPTGSHSDWQSHCQFLHSATHPCFSHSRQWNKCVLTLHHDQDAHSAIIYVLNRIKKAKVYQELHQKWRRKTAWATSAHITNKYACFLAKIVRPNFTTHRVSHFGSTLLTNFYPAIGILLFQTEIVQLENLQSKHCKQYSPGEFGKQTSPVLEILQKNMQKSLLFAGNVKASNFSFALFQGPYSVR